MYIVIIALPVEATYTTLTICGIAIRHDFRSSVMVIRWGWFDGLIVFCFVFGNEALPVSSLHSYGTLVLWVSNNKDYCADSRPEYEARVI